MMRELKEFMKHEAMVGLYVGMVMMIVVFLFVHFILGIEAFA
ncbi:hypothetical protein [Bacillus alkalicellulosilyticus]|nr:hypothetical protein [Bacillus alkalicellulosilyticus]